MKNKQATSNPPDSSRLDPHALRPDFPILSRKVDGDRPLIYLDNAASTQRPDVRHRGDGSLLPRVLQQRTPGIHTLSEVSTEAYEQARRTTAEFIGATNPCEVVFTAGTTAAINTVAKTWGEANLKSGDVILLLISEHHANIVPWHQLAERTGCRVEFVPIDEHFLISDTAIEEHLERLQPKLFAFGAASNTLGTEYPVERWTEMAHAVGATVLIDAAQAAPHSPVDVQAWDADFLVFSGHKVCGPTGIGVLWGKADLLEAMPPFLGGGGMINSVTTEGFTSHELPEKFEAGTPPIVEAIGLEAALRYLQRVGLNRIHEHEKQLGLRADAGLRAIPGVRVIGPEAHHKAGINSFVVEGVHAHDLSQFLNSRGVAVRAGHHCTMPLHQALDISASARASCYLYNTESEIDVFLQAVEDTRARFARSGRKRTRRRRSDSPATEPPTASTSP